MSILEQTTSGVSNNGQRLLIAGVEKIGKTTLGCDAPNALLIPLEQGYAAQTCRRVPMLSYWEHVEQLAGELIAGAQDGSIPRGTSLVWDSATALERLIHDVVIRTDASYAEGNPRNVTMNSAHGGYGKGYHVANQKFAQWLGWMDQLTLYGINIVITCHVFAAEVIDPAYGPYNTWDILLHSPKNQKEYGKREMLTQWADLVGFLHEPIFISKTERGKGDNKEIILAQGVTQGKGRVLEIERAPAWVAGNRYGLTGAIAIPADGGWNYIAQVIYDAKGIDLYKR